MKKLICLALVASLALLTAGCNRNNNNSSVSSQPEPSEQMEELETDFVDETRNEQNEIVDRLAGLEKDQYDGIEIEAAVLPRMALLPGSTIPVTVTVRNTGENTIHYAHGSGTFETPTALWVEVEGLQRILPQDNMGIATMDYAVKELKPGESMEHTFHIRAIEPHEDFDLWSHDLFNDEAADNRYIGDLEWGDLLGRHPDLTPAANGTYDVKVYFTYIVEDENDETSAIFGEPTGYAETTLQISVDDSVMDDLTDAGMGDDYGDTDGDGFIEEEGDTLTDGDLTDGISESAAQ